MKGSAIANALTNLPARSDNSRSQAIAPVDFEDACDEPSSRCRRAVWAVWRPVRARNADARARRAGRRVRQGPAGRRRFRRELADLFKHYVGRPSPLYHAERLSEAWRRRADLSEARRPEPHRRPQDQQHARPGAAHAADGQEARDRRDRRRPARRGHGHRLCPLRPGVRRLHGRGGHPPPEAERLQHEAAGRRSAARHQRLADAPRRDQRSDARLDVARRDDALHPRLGRRPAPVPADRPRLPVGHRPRDDRAIAGAARPAAGCGRRLRRRRQQRGRHVLPVRRA